MRCVTVGMCLLLAACGTMNGLGQDMQSAGASLSEKATEHQRPPPPAYPPTAYTPYDDRYNQP
jgi:predicted small secreted protein